MVTECMSSLLKSSSGELLLLLGSHVRELPAAQSLLSVAAHSHACLFPQSAHILFELLILENKFSDENKRMSAADVLLDG